MPKDESKETLKLILVTSIIEHKELKSIKGLAHGKNYYVLHHMDLCCGQFFLINI